MTSSIASHLASILPADTKVIPWEQVGESDRENIENAITGNPPDCLVFPDNSETLAEIVRIANENRWPLLIRGAGSKLDWGNPVNSPRIVVCTGQLNRAIEHAVGDLVITVEAGMTLADLQAFLAPSRQFLPVDPSYLDRTTIGGLVATADAGGWRQRYGGVRDLILGFSFVRHDGAIAKAGGRVVKNVAGYDMMKLFTGSFGTLGIISEVTLRLFPMISDSETLLITGSGESIAKLSYIIRQSALTPTIAEILTEKMVKALTSIEKIGLLLRFESIPESIAEQGKQIAALAGQLDCSIDYYRDGEERDLWQRYRNTMDHPGDKDANFCKIGILPSAFGAIVPGIDGIGSINIGSGVGKLILPAGADIARIRGMTGENQGYLSLLSAPKSVKESIEPWGYTGNSIDLMKTLKNKFDPNRIFNPERFINKI
ncbi:FAD-binding oxidoreductase [Pannus brasiliensis CCIBt3594]|uniref:FAD-binding oxidoreductase n=1 Tax=Pannus brasiliensis CCIBt3594 TaxID=1427578 RepID=A0AAW9QEP7_9CHRO